MRVKIKVLSEKAVIPRYKKEGDAGLDLEATSVCFDDHGNAVYGTGLAFEIPQGFVGLLFPRSSNAKTDLMLTCHVGVIDSGFRGEVTLKYARVGKSGEFHNCANDYEIGDRVGQLIIVPFPHIDFEEVNELAPSERGTVGYGSTGR